jgi:hypothetical protein
MLSNVAIQTAGHMEIYNHNYKLIRLVTFDYSRGKTFFSTPQRPNQLWGSPSLLSNGYRGSSARVKLLGREHNHETSSISSVNNGGATRLHGVVFN